MKERPILFSTPMITAILEGRKTQTRRLIKPQPSNFLSNMSIYGPQDPAEPKEFPMKRTNKNVTMKNNVFMDYDSDEILEVINFHEKGDRLWVRETWAHEYGGGFLYRASHSHMKPDGNWKPSIYMPRTVSRINLEVQSIRVERLQDITREDALSEGVYFDEGLDGYVTDKDGRNFHHSDPRISFCKLWISINGAESWDANPYVWVVNFKKLES